MSIQPLEKQLRKGWHFCWRDQIYRIESFVAHNLTLQACHLATTESLSVSLQALLDEEPTVRFAPTLEGLQRDRGTPPKPSPSADTLPAHLLSKAANIIEIVEAVEMRLGEALRQQNDHQPKPQRTALLKQILAQLPTPVGLTAFYKYRNLYQQHQGNRERIAAVLHRSTYNQTRMSAAQQHFLDTLILRYYARSRPPAPINGLPPSTIYPDADPKPLGRSRKRAGSSGHPRSLAEHTSTHRRFAGRPL